MAKILIIEDDPDIGRLIGLKLKSDGYDLAFAADAVTALTIARKEDPDLIVLDLTLPGGSGLVIMERLKSIANLAMKPVIVVTAQEPAQAEASAREAGAVDYFQKPLDFDALSDAIARELAD